MDGGWRDEQACNLDRRHDESIREGTMDLFKAKGFSAKAFRPAEASEDQLLPKHVLFDRDVRMPA
jgi:FixJ family two-component response regulator